MPKPIYTGIFFENDLHMTWVFDIEEIPLFPTSIIENDKAVVQIVGEYKDEEVACLIVQWQSNTHNPQGTYLHITTKADIEPYHSGLRATEYGYTLYENPYYLLGIWKYGF